MKGPKYDGTRLSIYSTTPLNAAVMRAAHKTMTSMNAYCRQAILAKLKNDGVELEAEFEEPRRAGWLAIGRLRVMRRARRRERAARSEV